MTQRQKDCSVEQKTSKILDQYYTKQGIKFERVTDKERQIKGIDLILFGKSGKSIKIDEKAKYRGLQKEGAQLNSYSFEVTRLCSDGVRRDGWFIDKKIETDYYCYAFPKLDNGSIKPKMQVDLFSKKDIIAIIEKETTLSYIEQAAHMMDVKGTRLIPFKNFALYRTPAAKLPEEPINIVMSRELIEKTPHFRRFYV